MSDIKKHLVELTTSKLNHKPWSIPELGNKEKKYRIINKLLKNDKSSKKPL